MTMKMKPERRSVEDSDKVDSQERERGSVQKDYPPPTTTITIHPHPSSHTRAFHHHYHAILIRDKIKAHAQSKPNGRIPQCTDTQHDK